MHLSVLQPQLWVICDPDWFTDTKSGAFDPYEKRVMEPLKISKDKRALKFCKKKLGTHLHDKRKREEMSQILQKMPKSTKSEK